MEIRPILSSLMRNKTGPVLVALQVALSLAILANALFIVNERNAVAARPSGLSDEHSTFYFTVRNLNNDAPDARLANTKRQLLALRSVSGVASASEVTQMPLTRSGNYSSIAVDRKQERETAASSTYYSADELVKTYGLRLVEGRDFRPEERTDVNEFESKQEPSQVIISKAQAGKLWPGAGSVVGKTFFFGTGNDAIPVQVVGVIERLQTPGAQVGDEGEYTTLFPQRPYGDATNIFAVRTEPGQRDRVMKEAETALRASSATPMIVKSKTVDEERKDRYRADVAMSWMLVTVSVLLLLVTCSGIVGMASLWVTQRRKQIGVRRALGARKLDILRYFLTENFMITSCGVFAGVLLGVALNHLLVSSLEMARLPVAYLAGGAVVFWALGVMAVYGPAWRAASISPALATRST